MAETPEYAQRLRELAISYAGLVRDAERWRQQEAT